MLLIPAVVRSECGRLVIRTKVDDSNAVRVKSKTEKLAPIASQVSVHHLRPRTRLVDPVSVYSDWVGYHVFLSMVLRYACKLNLGLSLNQLHHI